MPQQTIISLSPHELLFANGAFYEVRGVYLGALNQTDVIGLRSVSEKETARVDAAELLVPLHILEMARRGGMGHYVPMNALLEERSRAESAERNARENSRQTEWLDEQYKKTSLILTGFSTLPPSIVDLASAASDKMREFRQLEDLRRDLEGIRRDCPHTEVEDNHCDLCGAYVPAAPATEVRS